MSDTPQGAEIYTAVSQRPNQLSTPPPAPSVIVDEEDDTNVTVDSGTPCRRNGCKTEFVSDEINRLGDGEGTVCQYHPAPVRAQFRFICAHLTRKSTAVQPIFREGSKVRESPQVTRFFC
jgi:hypothetical protein